MTDPFSKTFLGKGGVFHSGGPIPGAGESPPLMIPAPGQPIVAQVPRSVPNSVEITFIAPDPIVQEQTQQALDSVARTRRNIERQTGIAFTAIAPRNDVAAEVRATLDQLLRDTVDDILDRAFAALQTRRDEEGCGAFFCAIHDWEEVS